MIGNKISAFFNDQAILEVTDGSITAAGDAGVRMGEGGDADDPTAKWTDFTVDQFTYKQSEYDSRGLQTAEIDAEGSLTTHTYDNAGRKIATQDALGYVEPVMKPKGLDDLLPGPLGPGLVRDVKV